MFLSRIPWPSLIKLYTRFSLSEVSLIEKSANCRKVEVSEIAVTLLDWN